MFARRLTFALASIACAAVLEGLSAIWALNIAHEHVLRGRVASDIQLAFEELTISKLRLRAWFIQEQLVPSAADDLRLKYQSEMRSTLVQLNQLSARAVELDGNDATRDEHIKRQDALSVLAESMAGVEFAAAKVRPLQTGVDTYQAWLAAGELFDIARGRDLRRLLSDSIARESLAVARERAAADQALRWMRDLLLGAAITIALAALLLAVLFARALRRPLEELNEGALALQKGQLSHRIPLEGVNEFSAVAHSMNAMAVQLYDHRTREIKARQDLEELVQARTTELQDALQALQKVDERRRRLFADISHELRTPTTAILGEAEITLRGPDKPQIHYRAALQRIVSTTRQLSAVIDDLLTMARSDIDALALNRHPIDLDEPLRDALEQAAALAHDRQITVQTTQSTPHSLSMLADPHRLRQLLILLLDNAVRYSHVGGLVTVSVQRKMTAGGDDARCEIHITDQGIGIAVQDLPRVFERSFRSTHARQHCADGSGFGLSIGRALVRAHGGEITLYSELGQGTTVLLELPLLLAERKTAT